MARQSARTAAKPSAKTAAKPSESAKTTTAAIVNTTNGTPRPRPRIIFKTSLLPTQVTVDENNPPANSNPSKDPDPPLPVLAQEAGAARQPITQTASGPTQALSGLTQAPDPVTTKAAMSTIQPDPAAALSKNSDDSSIAKKLAVALGKHSSGQIPYTNSLIAEIDRLKKLEAAAKKQGLPEIKRPDGHIKDLQKAMGLEDERAVYVSCRVSELLFIITN
jgi:hypothetical protein